MSVATHSQPAVEVRPLDAVVGAEISGVDLSQPLPTAAVDTILRAFAEHAVLVFHDQKLGPAELSRFTAYFGPLDIHHLAEKPFPDFPSAHSLERQEGWEADWCQSGRPALAFRSFIFEGDGVVSENSIRLLKFRMKGESGIIAPDA